MPTFLKSLFGAKGPTASSAATELVKREAELVAIPARLAAAEARLKRIADLSDDEHAAAEAELAAARRAKVRLEAQIAELRQAREEAAKVEAAAALRTRHVAAVKKAAEMEPAIKKYDGAAAALVEAARGIAAIDDEIAAVNSEIETARRAGLDVPKRIPTPQERFRSEPDRVDPDQEVVEPEWYIEGRPAGAMVTVDVDGRQVSTEAGAERRMKTRLIPGRRRPGRSIPSPAAALRIPAARVGQPDHWPKMPSC